MPCENLKIIVTPGDLKFKMYICLAENMNIDALRGGVAPKSHASARTVFSILEAPCLGD